MTKAILPAKLLLRNLYKCLSQRTSWQDILHIDRATGSDLEWWRSTLTVWNARHVAKKCKDLAHITTDASQSGWGATLTMATDHNALSKYEAQGFWLRKTDTKSSNCREIKAVLLALLAFLPLAKNKSIQLLSDNISTVAYINFQGGPSQDLTDITVQIWEVILIFNIDLKASHLAGRLNGEADGLSRANSRHEWMLHPGLFRYLDIQWGPHTIDRFASMNVTLLPKYNSRYADPLCRSIDALYQQDRGLENKFVNAPLGLMDAVLQIIETQQATATVVAQKWRAKR
ncbi:reverse transcriptase, partial [Elysia marginata]